MLPADTEPTALLGHIRTLIDGARQRAALAVNAELTLLYWQVGKRISEEELQGRRAGYGTQVVRFLAQELALEYGSGWSEKHLRHCLQFAHIFPDEKIVSTLWRQLSWSHLKEIIYQPDALKRDFYLQMAQAERWSVRQLRERISSMLYERTAISKKPEETIRQELSTLGSGEAISPDLVFKDPYFLDFLGLKDSYSEKDMEAAILSEMQRFITELGGDFAFMARQKRISIDNRDYYIDLLFYHRRLRCLVAIDLKLGDFEAAHKGQMELYLRYLERYEKMEGENTPVGLILCSGKNEEHIELLQLDQSNIRVAEYLTALPPREVLQDRLHRAIEIAHSRLAAVQAGAPEE